MEEKKKLHEPEITTYDREELEKPRPIFTGEPSLNSSQATSGAG